MRAQPEHHERAGALPVDDAEHPAWRPLILDRAQPDDARMLEALLQAGRIWRVDDTLASQLADLADTRAPGRDLTPAAREAAIRAILAGATAQEYGRWVYYPWSGRLVHLLPPQEFQELRLDRNRNQVTREEQRQLADLAVAVVGLSVGNAVALTLALEGGCGHIKLADFDTLALSNMNRIRAGVHDIGLPKVVLAARQIYEIAPYIGLSLYPDGLTADNVDELLTGEPRVDIVVDECDSLDMKLLLRERARALRLPVLMETADRSMLDVERFDLEPDRPIFHGLTGGLTSSDLRDLRGEARLGIVLKIVGAQTLSTRTAASMLEIDQSISTWPQLASDVAFGGASVVTAMRRIGLGLPLSSGRRMVDVEGLLAREPVPLPPASPEAAVPPPLPARGLAHPAAQRRIPELIRFVVEHATLAPSGGNCQPWHFYYDDEDTLWLAHDRERSRNLLDGTYRGSYLALGAAVENAAIAAAHRGYAAQVVLFPDDDDQTMVARLHFEARTGGQKPPDAADAADVALFAQIRERATNRRQSPRVPLSPGEREALLSSPGALARLQLLEDDEALAEVAGIVGTSDRVRFLCGELHREMMGELRWSPEDAERTRDGIDVATLELSPAQEVLMRLIARPDVAARLRALGGGKALEQISRKPITTSSAVGLLLLRDAAPRAWVEGGRAMQRAWLRATQVGLAFQPVTAALFMFEMLDDERIAIYTPREGEALAAQRERLRGVFGVEAGAVPAMLFRLARAEAPSVRALRLPVDQVLERGLPPR